MYKHHDFTHNIDKLAVQQDEMLKLCENHVKNNIFCIVVLAAVVNDWTRKIILIDMNTVAYYF